MFVIHTSPVQVYDVHVDGQPVEIVLRLKVQKDKLSPNLHRRRNGLDFKCQYSFNEPKLCQNRPNFCMFKEIFIDSFCFSFIYIF